MCLYARAVPRHRLRRTWYLMLSSVLVVAVLTACINQPSTSFSPAQARHEQPSEIVPTASSGAVPARPPFVASETADALTRSFTNAAAGYTVLLPAAWTVVVDGLGTAAFLTQAGLAARSGGWSDAEVSVGGIQFVGRIPQPTEDAQYEAILPNHCLEVDHRPVTINEAVGRVYTLDCDNPTGAGTHRRQQLYLPDGPRFIEIRLNVAPTVAGDPTPLLTAIAASLRRTTA